MKNYFLYLFLFICTAQIHAQQATLNYKMRLTRVYFSTYDFIDPNGPDPTIQWRSKANVLNDHSPGQFNYYRDDLPNGWQNISLNSYPGGSDNLIHDVNVTISASNPLNLCNSDIGFELGGEIQGTSTGGIAVWENDYFHECPFLHTSNNGVSTCLLTYLNANHNYNSFHDQYFQSAYDASLIRGRADLTSGPGVWKSQELQLVNSPFKLEYESYYTLSNAIESVYFAGNPQGGPIANTVCEGGSIYLYVELAAGLSGGKFQFERSTNGGSSWSPLRSNNNPYVKIATDSESLNALYRVRLDHSNGCLGDSEYTYVNDLSILNVFPSIQPENVAYTATGACNDETPNGSITITDLGIQSLPEDTGLELQLTKSSPGGSIAIPDITVGIDDLPYTFENLASGTYTLKATAVSFTSNGDHVIAECTTNLVDINVPRSNAPIIIPSENSFFGSVCSATPVYSIITNLQDEATYTFELFKIENGSANLLDETGPELTNFGQFSGITEPGDYKIRVLNENLCFTDGDIITIPEPAPADGQVNINAQSDEYDIACYNGRTSVELIPIGDYEYDLEIYKFFNATTGTQVESTTVSSGATWSVNLPAGEYFARFTRNNSGCSKDVVFSISMPSQNLFSSIESTTEPTNCMPNSGTATIVANGGELPHTIEFIGYDITPISTTFSNGQTTFFFDNLNSGEYLYSVSDASGCTDNDYLNINSAPSLSIGVNTQQLDCHGDTNGSISVSASNGVVPYLFKIIELGGDFSSQTLYENLAAGSYTIVVKDDNDCEASLVAIINEPPPITLTGISINPISCPGEGADVVILIEGNEVCEYAGGVRFAAQGSTPPDIYVEHDYEYSTDGGMSWQTIQQGELRLVESEECGILAALTISLLPDDYTILVREDDDYCTSINSFSLSPNDFDVPDPLEITITDLIHPTCAGNNNGMISFTYSGGRPGYELQLVSFGTTGPSPGNETILETVELDFNNTVGYSFAGLPANANGYGIQLKSTRQNDGSYLSEDCIFQYPGSWTTGENFTPILLIDPAPLTMGTITTTAPINCNGNDGTIEVTNVSGGEAPYRYAVNDEAFQDENTLLAFENNIVYVRDARGCEISQSYTVTDFVVSNLAVAFSVSPFTNCVTEGRIQLDITPGVPPYLIEYSQTISGTELVDPFRISTSDNIEKLEDLQPGPLYLRITDADLCTQFYTYQVPSNPPIPIVATTSSTPETCSGDEDGSLSISVSGGIPPYDIVFNGAIYSGPNLVIENMLSGDYSFGIRDAAGCQNTYEEYVDLNGSGIQITLDGDPVTPCFDNENGSIEVTVSGGEAPYQLSWQDDDGFETTIINENGSSTRSGLYVRQYDFIITDARGCSVPSTGIPPGPIPTLLTVLEEDITHPTCVGEATGSFTISVLADGTPLSNNFLISLNGATPVQQMTFDNLPAGEYQITATDDQGCDVIVPTVNLINQSTITATATITAATCAGEASGEILINASGQGPFTYELDGGGFQPSPTFSGLPAGTYEVIAENIDGCQTILSGLVVDDGFELSANFATSNTLCFQEATGSISALPDNGASPYTLSTDGFPSSTSLNIDNLPGGTYTAVLTDNNGCQISSEELTINEAPEIEALATPSPVSCTEATDGTIVITASGGSGNLQYRLEGGTFSTNNTFNGLVPDSYTVELIDGNNCIITIEDILIEVPDPITITLDSSSPDFCGQNNGIATLSAEGGTGNLSYLWPDGQTTNQRSDLAAGTYTVSVTDDNNCENTLNVIIEEQAAPTIDAIIPENALCTNDNGSIIVDVSGGTPPYSYAWSNGDESININNLPADTYDLLVTDAANCTVSGSTVINFIPPAIVTPQLTQSTCGLANGQISLAVSDGSGNYTYEWSANANSNSAMADNLLADDYAYTVTDTDSNCTTTGTVSITTTPNVSLTIEEQNDPTCFNGSGNISVLANGGTGDYSYNWSHNPDLDSPNAEDLPAGTYEITIFDDLGCNVSSSITLNEPDELLVDIEEMFPARCAEANGYLEIVASGGVSPYTYHWPHDNGIEINEANNLEPGTYIITVRDANMCETSLIAEVTNVDPPPVLELIGITPSYCGPSAGFAEVSTSGGNPPYDYTWSHNDFFNTSSLNTLDAGDYTVSVVDEAGCEDEISFTITEESPPITAVELIDETLTSCGQDNASLTVQPIGGTGPYTYTWWEVDVLNSATVTNLAPGEYQLTVDDINNCSFNQTFTVEESEGIVLEATTIVSADCSASNGSTIITTQNTNGQISYNWSHNPDLNSPEATGLAAGMYTVSVEDESNCSNELTIIINDNEAPEVSVDLTNAICSNDNGSISIHLIGGQAPFNYEWSHDSNLNAASAEGLTGGDYNVTITDANNCIQQINETLLFQDTPTLVQQSIISSSCGLANGSASIQVDGGTEPYHYSWSHDENLQSANAQNLLEGAYQIDIIDANNCIAITNFTIAPSEELNLVVINQIPENCNLNNGQISVETENATGFLTYNWSHDTNLNASIAQQLSAGDYSVTSTDENGCSAELTVSVGSITGPVLSLASSIDAICTDDTGSLSFSTNGGTPPFNYQWSHDPELNTLTASNLSSNSYSIIVTDAAGCMDMATEQISFSSGPVISLASNTASNCGAANGQASVAVENGLAPYTYSWSHNSDLNLPTANNLIAGNYTVVVSDSNDCQSELNLTIEAIEGPSNLFETLNIGTTCGLENGQLQLSEEGGTTPFNYSWSHDPTLNGNMADELPAGNYDVTLTDANDCTFTSSFQIEASEAIVIEVTEQTNATCSESNGSISIAVNNAMGQLLYTWSHDPDLNAPSATNIAAGAYSVMVIDENHCNAELNLNLSNALSPELTLTQLTDATCEEGTGDLAFEATGGTEPYTFSWSHDTELNNPVANALNSGSYSITIIDAEGCIVTNTETIDFLPGPILELTQNDNSSCGFSNGVATVAVEDGTAPFNYIWSHNASNAPSTSNLPEGNHTVSVIDANMCTAELSVITENTPGPSSLQIINELNTTCGLPNGTLQVAPLGGSAPFDYQWSHTDLNSGTLTELAGGTYNLTLTDDNGCSLTEAYDIATSGILQINLEAMTSPDCNLTNGVIHLSSSNATGDVRYDWSHDDDLIFPEVDNLAPGMYTITATDDIGCTATYSTLLENVDAPNIVNINNQASLCEDGQGSLSFTIADGVAPYHYTWSHDDELDSATATQLLAGDYQLTVTDDNGCILLTSASVILASAPTLTIDATEPPCDGPDVGVLNVNSTGGTAPITIAWNTGQNTPTITDLAIGSYSVSVTDANTCTSIETIELNGLGGFELEVIPTPPSCYHSTDGSVSAIITDGTSNYSYLWNNGGLTESLNNLSSDTYAVTVIDTETGCIQYATTDLVAPDSLQITTNSTPNCFGDELGTISAEINGGIEPYQYNWDNGAQTSTLTNIEDGNYTLMATDANGCEKSISAIVGVLPVPNYIINEITSASCPLADGQVIITTDIETTSLMLDWNGNSSANILLESLTEGGSQITVSQLLSGNYPFSISNNDFCITNGEIDVPDTAEWVATVGSTNEVNCAGGNDGSASIIISGGGTFDYLWDDTAGNQTTATASNLSAGNYSATVTEASGCEQFIELTISEPEPLNISTIDSTAPLCNNESTGSISLAVEGGTPIYDYNWSDLALPNSPILENLATGNYELTVTDAQGCEITYAVNLANPDPINLELDYRNSPNCFGGNNGEIAVLSNGGTGTLNYLWNDPNQQTTAIANQLLAGSYTVTITDENNCIATLNTSLSEGILLTLDILEIVHPACVDVDNGSITVLAEGSPLPITYNWQNGNTGPFIGSLAGAQSYSVTATSTEGCMEELTIDMPEVTTLQLGFPSDTTLCLDDLLVLDLANYPIREINGPGGFSSTDEVVLLETAGNYILHIEDENGCVADEEINLSFNTTPLIAGMVLASDIVVTDTLLVLETSWPVPDQTRWIFDETAAQLIRQELNQYWFFFEEPGTYELSLIAGQNNCEDMITKTVTVHADSTTIPGANLGVLRIEEIVVSPNPNQGEFNVNVVLNAPASVFINLYNMNSVLEERRQGNNAPEYDFSFDTSLQAGSYLLTVQTERERRAVVVVIQ